MFVGHVRVSQDDLHVWRARESGYQSIPALSVPVWPLMSWSIETGSARLSAVA